MRSRLVVFLRLGFVVALLVLATIPFHADGQTPRRRGEPSQSPVRTASAEPGEGISIPARIRPGMTIEIRAYHVHPQEPLDGTYLVEPSGKVPLGFVYGRFSFLDMTWEEAEAALVKYLKEKLQLKDPQVLITAPGVRRPLPQQEQAGLVERLDRIERELRELRGAMNAVRARPRPEEKK